MTRINRYCIATLLICSPLWAQANLPAGTELRAYLNESCVVADEPYLLPEDDQVSRAFPFTSIIVGKLIHAMVNGAIQATASQLDKVSRQKDMYFVAAKDVNLYSAELGESPEPVFTGQLSCATIVAANFAPDNSDCTHQYVPKIIPAMPIDDGDLASSTIREDDSVENILRRANICLEGPPRSVYEFRFEYSDDGTAFRVEKAGLWMNSLLSTDSKRAKRNVVYTMEIAEPARDSDMRVLASAWMHVGEVSSGMEAGSIDFSGRSDWLRVPTLSGAAAAAYQRDTAIHQDVYAEIQALERSVTRSERMLAGLNDRLGSASDNVRDALMDELDSTEFRMLRAESLLDARRAEYDELPHWQKHYMPVTVRVSIIESRSERRALSTLSKHLKKNSKTYASAATDMATAERSFDITEDIDDTSALEEARQDYFDALVAIEEAEAMNSADIDAAKENLVLTRDIYNSARSQAGIPEIE